MKTLKNILGTEIKITPNYSKKTFTIRKNGLKFRTIRMEKREFDHASRFWTGNDWDNFMKTDEYYRVK